MVSYRGEMEEGMSLINVFLRRTQEGRKDWRICTVHAHTLRVLRIPSSPSPLWNIPISVPYNGANLLCTAEYPEARPSAWGRERREEKDKRDLFPSPQRFPSPFFRAQSELFILPLLSPLPPLAESFSPDNRPGGSVNSSRTFPLQ